MSRRRSVSSLLPLLLFLLVPTVADAQTVKPLPTERRELPKVLERTVEGSKAASSQVRVVPSPDHQCVFMDMSCGETVTGSLTNHDCLLDDDTRADFWLFDGDAGDTVTIDLTSNQFDSFLFLLDPEPTVVAADDDSGPGTNARIVFDLDSSGEWVIAANNIIAGELGNYTLSLTCDGGGPPPGPVAAPTNLTAVPFSPTDVELRWKDNANNETLFAIERALPGQPFEEIGIVDANSAGAIVEGLPSNTEIRFRVKAENATTISGYSNVATARTFYAVGNQCIPRDTVMCLNDDRFQVQVSWRTAPGNSGGPGGTGLGRVVPGVTSDDSGLFYFFRQDNWEMLLKVLDGCPVNDRYWVFFAATTTVEFSVHVGDTATGDEALYYNPLGQRADAVTDTNAFATCP